MTGRPSKGRSRTSSKKTMVDIMFRIAAVAKAISIPGHCHNVPNNMAPGNTSSPDTR